jgi:hypothetical protein
MRGGYSGKYSAITGGKYTALTRGTYGIEDNEPQGLGDLIRLEDSQRELLETRLRLQGLTEEAGTKSHWDDEPERASPTCHPHNDSYSQEEKDTTDDELEASSNGDLDEESGESYPHSDARKESVRVCGPPPDEMEDKRRRQYFSVRIRVRMCNTAECNRLFS